MVIMIIIIIGFVEETTNCYRFFVRRRYSSWEEKRPQAK